jgi:hypothetical protein
MTSFRTNAFHQIFSSAEIRKFRENRLFMRVWRVSYEKYYASRFFSPVISPSISRPLMDHPYTPPKAQLIAPPQDNKLLRTLPAAVVGLALIAMAVWGLSYLTHNDPFPLRSAKFWLVTVASSGAVWGALAFYGVRSPWVAGLLGGPMCFLGLLLWVCTERMITGTIHW